MKPRYKIQEHISKSGEPLWYVKQRFLYFFYVPVFEDDMFNIQYFYYRPLAVKYMMYLNAHRLWK